MIVPDVNLLAYAYNADTSFHPQAKRWWEACLGGSQPVGIPWAVALGYLRLMTSRTVLPRPLDMAIAVGHLRQWLEQPAVLVLQPGPRHLAILSGFCEAGMLTSSLMTDAHIAAMAIENQAVVHSNDSDFGRFAGLRWINPLHGDT